MYLIVPIQVCIYFVGEGHVHTGMHTCNKSGRFMPACSLSYWSMITYAYSIKYTKYAGWKRNRWIYNIVVHNALLTDAKLE